MALNQKIVKIEGVNDTYAKYEIYPLARGYGNTFVTPLRRILLSSIKGASITKLKIKGVDHEFSTVKGIKEDVLRIILNLRKVVFRLDSSESETLTLKVHGKKIITASDIKLAGNVKVINPDTYICELTDDKSELEIEIFIETGLGFAVAEQEIRNSEVGWIPVNKNFSPVDKVNYNVVSTRVGQQTDLEKIIIEVTTNGCVSPDEAIKEAFRVFNERLQELNTIVQEFDGSIMSSDKTKEEE
jgi:DNA-directed RNA polymerase subunit alpha